MSSGSRARTKLPAIGFGIGCAYVSADRGTCPRGCFPAVSSPAQEALTLLGLQHT